MSQHLKYDSVVMVHNSCCSICLSVLNNDVNSAGTD